MCQFFLSRIKKSNKQIKKQINKKYYHNMNSWTADLIMAEIPNLWSTDAYIINTSWMPALFLYCLHCYCFIPYESSGIHNVFIYVLFVVGSYFTPIIYHLCAFFRTACFEAIFHPTVLFMTWIFLLWYRSRSYPGSQFPPWMSSVYVSRFKFIIKLFFYFPHF